jgi:hypothetical protein
MSSLFSTHPPMEERIARLQSMGGQTYAQPRPQASSAPRRGPWGGAAPQTPRRGPWG